MADRKQLRPFGRWDVLWRGVYEHGELAVDVDFFDFGEKIRLYRDGRLLDEKRSPARFELDGGRRVEAAMSLMGMKYVRMVDTAGARTTFQPAPGTGEERRARFERSHPTASRVIAALAWTILVVALVTQIPELLNLLGHLTGWSVPTFDLPTWLNTTLGVGGLLAALDRALRMKYNPWLDD